MFLGFLSFLKFEFLKFDEPQELREPQELQEPCTIRARMRLGGKYHLRLTRNLA
jgi:hypothetical protein